MPYVTFPRDSMPGFGVAHASKQDAINSRSGDDSVGFDASPEERAAWQEREQSRLDDETYTAVPWAERLRQMAGIDAPDVITSRDEYRGENPIVETFSETERLAALVMLGHFAHVSTEKGQMLAYTPDDCFGHEDRQKRVAPGRYLEEFWPKHLSGEIQAMVGAFKARCGKELVVTMDSDVIVDVYMTNDSPTSCMDGEHFSYDSNPVRVYGSPGDLGLAYIGIPGDCIAARAIVWPANKTYSRVYGDTHRMKAALEAAGWTEGHDVSGAHIRAIPSGDGYVMPYIDDANWAELVRRNGVSMFRLGSGDYDVKVTGGVAPISQTCSDCGGTFNDRGETECEDCRNSISCDSCGYRARSDDTYSHSHGTLCDSCNDDFTHTCEVCEDDYNEYDISGSERRRRNRIGIADSRCPGCEDSVKCYECDDWTDTVDDDERCDACAQAARAETLRANSPAPRQRGTVIARYSATTGPVQS